MQAVDDYIPTPERDSDKPFMMPVEDVFSITGRGTVATGRVERGQIKVGEEVEIIGMHETSKTTVTGVEMFRKLLDYAEAGDNIGALLRGVAREDVQRGQVLAAPGSITPHTKFKAEVYVLSKDEGGRHTPFFTNYRPQFYFRTTDVTGVVNLPEGTEMVMPGDNVEMTVELIAPIAIEDGTRFSIREGGRTVGSGVVTEILNNILFIKKTPIRESFVIYLNIIHSLFIMLFYLNDLIYLVILLLKTFSISNIFKIHWLHILMKIHQCQNEDYDGVQ